MNQKLQNNLRNQNNRGYTTKTRKRKHSSIPLLVLFGIFLICFILYAVQFFGTHNSEGTSESSAVETSDVMTSEPSVTEPSTTEPITTEPPTTEPVTTEAKTTEPEQTTNNSGTNPSSMYTVILDPGHGFGDVGCSSEYLQGQTEKDITLDLCQRVTDLLSRANINVILTHDGTTFPSVAELNQMATKIGFSMESYIKNLISSFGFDKNGNPVDLNTTWNTFLRNLSDSGNGANLFNVYERAYYTSILNQQQHVDAMVSIHVNSVDVSDPNVDIEKFSGYTISYCTSNENAEASKLLHKKLAETISASFESKKVTRYADPWYDSFVITKYSSVPSVLIETGYCVKEDEAADLLSEAWRQKMAWAIVNGIVNYLAAD